MISNSAPLGLRLTQPRVWLVPAVAQLQAGATDRLLGALRAVERTRVQGERYLEPRARHGWFVALALVLLAVDAVIARSSSAAGRRLRTGDVGGQA